MSCVVKKIMFVEGVNDARFVNTIFEEKFVAISAKGVTGVLTAVEQVNRFNKDNTKTIDVIGFIDKDYLDVYDEDGVLNIQQVITTEYRDIEIDLLHTNAAKKLLDEKASPGKWECEQDVVREVLSELKRLSSIRAYSYVNRKTWSFKEIDMCKYTNTTGVINYTKLESAFKQNNHIPKGEWNDFESWYNSTVLCEKSITRGHDATCVLGQMLRSKLVIVKKMKFQVRLLRKIYVWLLKRNI